MICPELLKLTQPLRNPSKPPGHRSITGARPRACRDDGVDLVYQRVFDFRVSYTTTLAPGLKISAAAYKISPVWLCREKDTHAAVALVAARKPGKDVVGDAKVASSPWAMRS